MKGRDRVEGLRGARLWKKYALANLYLGKEDGIASAHPSAANTGSTIMSAVMGQMNMDGGSSPSGCCG